MENAQADCRQVLERLYLYLDGEIGPEDCAEIDRHLEVCRRCFEHVDFERVLKAIVARKCQQSDMPLGLSERVRGLLRKFGA